MLSSLSVVVALSLVLAATALVRWRLIDVPLDRDEGEYAYLAQQWLAGVPPYESGYAMKMPGIYAVYSVVLAVFGHSTRGVHLGLLVANAASIGLVFLIGRRLLNAACGVIAAACFALLSIDWHVHGSSAQAEPFALVPALFGIWLLMRAADPTRQSNGKPRLSEILLSGVCLGAAPMIKQHALPYALFGAWYLLDRWWRVTPRASQAVARQWAIFLGGALVPAVAVIVTMLAWGVSGEFWFWTITYARNYASSVSWGTGLQQLEGTLPGILAAAPVVWTLAFFGVVAACADPAFRVQRAFLLSLLAAGILAVVPGFYFRHHYFVLLLPSVSLLTAVGCDSLARVATRFWPAAARPQWLATALAALAIGTSAWIERDYLFTANRHEVARLIYWRNPFPENEEIARFVTEQSLESGPIMVIGSEPQIYFYSRRRAASPHIYMYPLMEPHDQADDMQRELAAHVDEARPEWIVYESVGGAWLQRPDSPTHVFDWLGAKLRGNYQLVGLVDIHPDGTRYHLGPAARQTPQADHWLSIHHRKGAQAKAK